MYDFDKNRPKRMVFLFISAYSSYEISKKDLEYVFILVDSFGGVLHTYVS